MGASVQLSTFGSCLTMPRWKLNGSESLFIAVLRWTLLGALLPAIAANSWLDARNAILQEEEVGDLRCARLMSDVKWTEATMNAKLPPVLSGTWVSQRCEVRPGPEFVLRKYQFFQNNSFKLMQYHYADHQCTTPTYAALAEGILHMTAPSWVVPGGMESDYLLSRVQVRAYSADMADVLMVQVNRSCPGYVVRKWHANHWYTAYSYVESEKGNTTNDVEVVEDIDCLDALWLAFHELQLCRTERRKSPRHRSRKQQWKGRKTELLLGDVHSSLEQRKHYRPTGYQQPLLRLDQTKTCSICRLISKATDVFPPHLESYSTTLPLQLQGEWISTRCETRSYSMFLGRQLLFYEDGHQIWQGIYRFYLDPKCRKSIFTLTVRGQYFIGNASDTVEGATEVDFSIDSIVVTAHTLGMVENLNGHVGNACGIRGGWNLNVPMDVTSTGGCSGLGLKVPSREIQIGQLDLDRYGNLWLYIGQPAYLNSDIHSRPTSYQLPLLQCRMQVYEEIDNALYPLPGAAIYSSRLQASENCGSCFQMYSDLIGIEACVILLIRTLHI